MLPSLDSSGVPVPRAEWSATGVRRWIERLAALGETPHRTAVAFGIGVFLSFSPFLGFQILLGLGSVAVFRLSRMAVFIGLCTNLPWITVPWYALTTAVGAMLLRFPFTADARGTIARLLENPLYGRAFWEQASEFLGPLVWSFLVGSTIGATVVGLSAYLVMARILKPACPPNTGV